ncbi:MAG: tail fiber protein [Bacteroidetes bacterium]|nr:tail fiber protein [Bacteroidota bacterium]
MKTIIKFSSILLLSIISNAFTLNVLAENFEFKTTLVHEVSKSITPVASVDCNGNSTPGAAVNYTAIEIIPAPTSVDFKVYYTDNLGTVVYSYGPLSAAAVNYNATTGEISYIMTGISKTRKSLTAKVFLDGSGTAFESKEFYTSSANTNPPIGTIIPYYGTAASVAALNLGGWFLCDGTSIASISADVLFPDEKTTLQSIIGSANLPDLRGLFLRGIDPAGGTQYDPDADRAVGNVQDDAFQNHTHTGVYAASATNNASGNVSLSVGTTGTSAATSGSGGPTVVTSVSVSGDTHSHSITNVNNNTTSTSNSANANATETRPVNAAVNYLIKVRY